MSKRVEAQTGNISVNPITGIVQFYDNDVLVATTTAQGSGGLLVDKGAGLEQIAVVSEITGVITTTSPLSVQADINTATPPTNEAVTGTLRFRDLADDDTLGSLGYTASSVLQLTNNMQGSNMEFVTENAAGTAQTLITLDPDTESVILPSSNDAVTPTLAFGDGDTGFYESADDTLQVSLGGTIKASFTSARLTMQNGAVVSTSVASATVPVHIPSSNDLDTGVGTAAADQLSLIAGAKEMLRLVETGVATTDQIIISPAGIIGAVATPALAFGDGDTGFFESSDDLLGFVSGGAGAMFMDSTYLRGTASNTFEIRHSRTASSTSPIYTFRADDDTGINRPAADQLSLIAGAKEMLRLVETGVATTDQIIIAPAGIIGAAATPSLAFGDGDSGFYESGDDNIVVSLGTVATWDFNGSTFQGVAAGTPALLAVDSTATVPNILPWKGDTDTGLGQGAADQLALIAGGKEMLRLVETGVATTDQVIIAPAGIIGAVATPALAFGDGDTGFYESADDSLYTAVAGVAEWFIDNGQAGSTISTGPRFRLEGASATNPTVIPSGGDGDTGLGQNLANEVSIITGAVEATRFIAREVQTTNATVTEIVSLAVASGESFGFEIHIIGTENGTGDTVFERVFGAIRNQGGTTALVGSTITDRTDDAGATTWVVSVEADDTGDALTVDVTGEAAHTIDWKVRVELLNV